MTELEAKKKEVWERIAEIHPEFTPDHDALKNPWAVEALLLGPQINTGIFPGGNVLDLGANGGILTAYWAINGANVTAYEPDPTTFNSLVNMLERTNLNVKAVRAAVWTHGTEVKFRSNLKSTSLTRGGCLSVEQRPTGFYDGGENEEYMVPCVSFQDALDTTEWDCVKMDIEGAEFEILLSTPIHILRERIKYLQLEFHHEWATDSVYKDLMEKLEPYFEIDGYRDHDNWKTVPGRYLWAHLWRK